MDSDSDTDIDGYEPDPPQLPQDPNLIVGDEESDDEDDSDFEMDNPGDELSEPEDDLLEDEDDGDLEAELETLREPSGVDGRDGTKWTTDPHPPARRPAANKIVHRPGPTRYARFARTFTEVFDLFFDRNIINLIITCTNNKARSVYQKDGKPWRDIDEVELKAFIGLLYAQGVLHDHRRSLGSLWRRDGVLSSPIYSAAFSRDRFREIARFIRFDDHLTTEARRKCNRYEPIREMADAFISNCKKAFNPSAHLCIDEQLMPFSGKCGFRVFMKAKPDKEGLKWWLCCDVATLYVCNMQLYLGKLFVM